MPLYDASHNLLTTEQAVATLVDDGSTTSALYGEATTHKKSNLLTAIAAAAPAVPDDGAGNLALTATAWEDLCYWAGRPYDSMDQIDLLTVLKEAIADLESTGGGSPESQANILLDLIWMTRIARRQAARPDPNPVRSPNDLGDTAVWSLNGGLSVSYSAAGAPDGTSTVSYGTFGSGSYGEQTVNVGRAISGVTYKFQMLLRAPSKATISLTFGSASSSADDTHTVVSLGSGWALASVQKTFSTSGNELVVGLDNRTGSGGDGIAGDVYMWAAAIVCLS